MNPSLIFKALGDDNRLRIIEILKSGEKCACDILDELHIVQSTLSHHMKSLCEVELVNSRKDGKWVHYSLNKETLQGASAYLQSISVANSNQTNTFGC